ncbi:pto-interacting protein 1-like [Apium graveolens]|uniref:pto-interacting protein 1-like n=1 Tax=Apium graveolens TaxID=4045 RepID=UPI003D7908F7
MGFSQCTTCAISQDSPSSNTPVATSENDDKKPSKFNELKGLKIKTLLQKMIWEFGLSCFIPASNRLEHDKNVKNGEHNKAWLLAETGPELTNADPHSSFRFSFCSQVELESMNANNSCSSTVLMVNLDNGLIESGSRELKWSRIESLERTISPVVHTLVRFTYDELLHSTHNFSKGRVLGRGALSYVFRGKVGFLRTTVAVKRLDKEDKESSKAFCRELMIASSLHNPLIVPLVGFCVDPDEGLFLVYKYVSGGSLERYLHEKKKGVKGGCSLPWSVRYKVATGIAEAIGYLHNGTHRCVVHRDIKPSNILLSSNKNPKLCDFGLATWTEAPSVPFLCKTVKGTFGYLAPEYFQHGKISDKTDVYAFGVVLLELLTGRKPIETRTESGDGNLISWAKPLLQQGAIEKLIDPNIKFTQKNFKQISRMVQAAAACIANEESRRSNINEIISILKEVEPNPSNKKNSSFPGNGSVTDCYTPLQQSRSDIKDHLALAMLGVSEVENDEHLGYLWD